MLFKEFRYHFICSLLLFFISALGIDMFYFILFQAKDSYAVLVSLGILIVFILLGLTAIIWNLQLVYERSQTIYVKFVLPLSIIIWLQVVLFYFYPWSNFINFLVHSIPILHMTGSSILSFFIIKAILFIILQSGIVFLLNKKDDCIIDLDKESKEYPNV